MSERVRFTLAEQVLEAFPNAADSIALAPGGLKPLDFLRRLIAQGRRFDAVTFAAFVLPRREAVWWGCQCVRAVSGVADEALAAAEAWVRNPDDASRYAALALADKVRRRTPTHWLAFAAGHSGGNIAPEGAPPVTPGPHMAGSGVKAGVILALAQKPAREQPAWTVACAEAALRFAEGGDAKVRPPAAG